MFENDITACQLTHIWWARPPVWRCILCKVDASRQRVKPFTVEAESAELALGAACAEAKQYEFPEVTQTYVRKTTPDNASPIGDLGLEIDL